MKEIIEALLATLREPKLYIKVVTYLAVALGITAALANWLNLGVDRRTQVLFGFVLVCELTVTSAWKLLHKNAGQPTTGSAPTQGGKSEKTKRKRKR